MKAIKTITKANNYGKTSKFSYSRHLISVVSREDASLEAGWALLIRTVEPRSKASAYKAMPAYKAFTKNP